jgi:hypothetical protein
MGIFLSDALGSVLATFSNTAGSARLATRLRAVWYPTLHQGRYGHQ